MEPLWRQTLVLKSKYCWQKKRNSLGLTDKFHGGYVDGSVVLGPRDVFSHQKLPDKWREGEREALVAAERCSHELADPAIQRKVHTRWARDVAFLVVSYVILSTQVTALRLVYTYDARTSISTSASTSHVGTGTTQAQAQEQGTRACACVVPVHTCLMLVHLHMLVLASYV